MSTFVKLALAVFGWAALLASQPLLAQDNNGAGMAPADAPVGSISGPRGLMMCAAAVNSTGTVAGGTAVDTVNTIKLGTGTYQVAFKGLCNSGVAISGGWFRVVQPDTLTFGTLPDRSCIVADRAGVPKAIWVQCFDTTGAAVDTSFTVMEFR